MVPPLLKLLFLKGPREGETLEYKPGSTVRVGRIVRGNDVAIKDAGISTKHLRIESESGKWMIQDLGSSNGTVLNSTSLPEDTPVDLRHGDTIKLGEYTSIVVNFEIDDQDKDTVQEYKLPPRPKRNNRGKAVVDSDPVGSVLENPTRKGRSAKQGIESSNGNEGEQALPRRGRASRSKIAEEVAVEVKVLEEKDEKKVNSRAARTRKNKGLENSGFDGEKVATEEDDGEERQGKKGNSRVHRSRNIESTPSSCLDSGNLGIEKITEGVDDSEVRDEKRVTRRGTRSKKIETDENSDTAFEVSEKQDVNKLKSRVTRSKKNEIPGDSYLELEKVQSQARKRCAGRKKKEEKPVERVEAVPMEDHKDTEAREEAQISDVKHGVENGEDTSFFQERRDSIEGGIDSRVEKDCVEAANDRCEEVGSGAKSIELVKVVAEKNASGEEGESDTVREETEDLQDQGLLEECHGDIDEERDYRNAEACSEASSDRCDDQKGTKISHVGSVDQVRVDLGKMTLGQWFDFLEVHLPKQIIDETEKMIAPMRSKTRRVYDYIQEQKKAKGKEVKG